MIEVISYEKLNNFNDILEISNQLSKKLNEEVVIINYKLLRIEE